jgi:peptidoglycan/LPS O-acetylase OafA/YrhL
MSTGMTRPFRISTAKPSAQHSVPIRANERSRGTAVSGRWALGFVVLILKGLVMPLDMGFEQGHALGPQLAYTTFALLMVVPFVLGRGSRSLVHRFADTPVMVFLGTISYGIFLWHHAVINWINFEWTDASRRNGAALLVIGLGVVVTIPIATASWYLVERPALRWKQRTRRS